jgi:hypothetical protein
MRADIPTCKMDGICTFASFYMSVCCRTELFLNSGELNPSCPDCNRPTQWVIVLRRGCSVGVPTQRVELRRSIRYAVADGDLLVVCVEWNSSRAEDARVLNFSERGMAIEIPGPAKILSEIKLLSRERNFAQVGQIRHCSPRGDVYVAGIAFSHLYRGLDLKLWLPKDDPAGRVTSGAEDQD